MDIVQEFQITVLKTVFLLILSPQKIPLSGSDFIKMYRHVFLVGSPNRHSLNEIQILNSILWDKAACREVYKSDNLATKPSQRIKRLNDSSQKQ